MALSKVNPNFITSTPFGRRNLIGNGAMAVMQRGQVPQTALTGAGYHQGPDRFRRSVNSSTGLQVTRDRPSTGAPEGFKFSLKETVTQAFSGNNATNWAWRPIDYRIEGRDVTHLKYGTNNAETTTLSFYVKSSGTGVASVIAYVYDTGGNAETFSLRYTINAANVWERKQLVIPGNTSFTPRDNHEIGYNFIFYADAGTGYQAAAQPTAWGAVTSSHWTGCTLDLSAVGSYIQFTGLQFELGNIATPFEHVPFYEDESHCHRYFFAVGPEGNPRGSGNAGAILTSHVDGSTPRMPIPYFENRFRDTPSVTHIAASNGGTGALTEFSSGTNRSQSGVYDVGTHGGGYAQFTTSFGNASRYRAEFNAEL